MTINKHMNRSWCVGFCAVAVLIFAPALAAAAAGLTQTTAGPEDGSPKEGLTEIVVTAQRRDESIKKVPISITALSQQSMDDLQIKQLNDLATVVPGLFIPPNGSTSNGATDFSVVAIRGILSAANAPVTQIYIDETPIAIRQLPGPFSKSPEPYIFDLDRVEVLRGPQGTLFGASAMGGAIRFLTPQPNLDQASGFAKADFAYTEAGAPSYEAGAAYGAPLASGTAGFRVSAWYQRTGGFIDREDLYTNTIYRRNGNESNAYVVHPAIKLAPNESLTVTAAFFAQHKHSENPDSYWGAGLPGPATSGFTWGGTTQSPLTDDLRVASLSVKYHWAGLTLNSDTSYLYRNLEAVDDATTVLEQLLTCPSCLPAAPAGLQAFSAYGHDFSSTRAWQQEFRLASDNPGARVNWVAGFQYRHAVEGVKQLFPTLSPLTEAIGCGPDAQCFGAPDYEYNGQSLSSYSLNYATDVSEALFGNVTVNLTARLQASLGVRIEHTAVQDQTGILAGGFSGVTYQSTAFPNVAANPVTPRASLTYQYTDNNMVYGTVAKGYRPGGAQFLPENPLCDPSLQALGLTSVPKGYAPDSLWSYEVGAKGFLFDRRLSYDGSVYYIRWDDVQTQVGLTSCGNNFTSNAGRAISQGFDLQLTALITQDLKLGVLTGYTHAYYPDATYGGAAAPGAPRPILNDPGQPLGEIGQSGSGSLAQPRWTAAANLNYSHDISSLWSESQGYLRLDYRWLGKQPCSCDYTNVTGYDPTVGPYPNNSYGILNLRLGLTHGGADVSAYVNNVTDANPRLNYGHYGSLSPYIFEQALRPRTFGLTAWYRF